MHGTLTKLKIFKQLLLKCTHTKTLWWSISLRPVNNNSELCLWSFSNSMSPLIVLQLSRDCKVEVQRILHQRALDVKLDPELQRRCMADLWKWCSEKTKAGQELECLQDHLEDLISECRDVVGNLTELESQVLTATSTTPSHNAVAGSAAEDMIRMCPKLKLHDNYWHVVTL